MVRIVLISYHILEYDIRFLLAVNVFNIVGSDSNGPREEDLISKIRTIPEF